jgi:hypothetical protein
MENEDVDISSSQAHINYIKTEMEFFLVWFFRPLRPNVGSIAPPPVLFME